MFLILRHNVCVTLSLLLSLDFHSMTGISVTSSLLPYRVPVYSLHASHVYGCKSTHFIMYISFLLIEYWLLNFFQGYGQADHSVTVDLLRKKFPDYSDISWKDEYWMWSLFYLCKFKDTPLVECPDSMFWLACYLLLYFYGVSVA